MRGPLSFKESDLKRAIRAAMKAGLEDYTVEITKKGSILIRPGKPESESETPNPWDEKP